MALMTDQQQQSEPTEQERQTAAQIYMAMVGAHEFGLAMQRRLIEMNALPGDKKLFQTRRERRERPE